MADIITEENESSLFTLSIDPVIKNNLRETARWAKILAIAGIFLLFVVVLAGVYRYIKLSELSDAVGAAFEKAKIAVILTYIILLAVAFFPMLYIFRFSSKMKQSLNTNDQQSFVEAFVHLKIYFKYLGIVVLISIVLLILSFFFGVLGAAVVA